MVISFLQLREYAKVLQGMVSAEVGHNEIQLKIEEFMGNIYRIVAICLGIPPKTFTWEYYDKTKQYCVMESMKPIDFYENLVKPMYNVQDKVSNISLEFD